MVYAILRMAKRQTFDLVNVCLYLIVVGDFIDGSVTHI